MIFPQKEAGQISPDFGSTWKNLNMDYFCSNIRGIWTPSVSRKKFARFWVNMTKSRYGLLSPYYKGSFEPFLFPAKISPDFGSTWKNLNIDYFRSNMEAFQPFQFPGKISPDFGSTWKNLNIDYFRSNIRGIWNLQFPSKISPDFGSTWKNLHID